MEVEEKTHVPRPAAAPPSRSAAGAGAPFTADPAVATAATHPAPGPGSAVPAGDPALPSAPAPQPPDLPGRLLAFVDRHRRKLFAAVLALYLLAFNGQWRLDADSALYLTIGRNLAEGRGYTYHGLPHTLAYPGMPWLFAGLFRLFGGAALAAADVVMLGCGLAALALTYRLFLLHAGRPTAVLITVALALSRTFFRYSFELLSDMPFLMGVSAFLAGCEAVFYRRADDGAPRFRWYDVALLVGGLAVAVVTRPTMWALLAAVVVVLALSLFRRPLRWTWLAGGAAVAAAAAVTVGVTFHRLGGDYERVFLDAMNNPGEVTRVMFRRNLPEVLHPGAAEAVFGVDWGHLKRGNVLPLGAIPSLLSIAAGVALIRRRLLWGVWVAMSVVMMLVTLVEVRYFLQVLPLLLYGWWLMLVAADRALAARLGSRLPWLTAAPVVVFASMVGVNAGRAAYLAMEQRSVPFLEGYRRGKYSMVPELTKLLETQTPPGAWVLVPERQLGRILTFMSRRHAVEPGPLAQLNPEVQTVYVLEPLEADVRAWMPLLRIGVGEPVGPVLRGRRGRQWQLHKAVRTPPPPPDYPVPPVPGAPRP